MLEKRSPVAIIVLSLVTCGLYYFYLIYALSSSLRSQAEEEMMAPGLELLLCIICLPYIIYWVYKYSKAVYYLQRTSDIQYPTDNTVLNVILSVFGFGLISMAIMQSDINRVIDLNAR